MEYETVFAAIKEIASGPVNERENTQVTIANDQTSLRQDVGVDRMTRKQWLGLWRLFGDRWARSYVVGRGTATRFLICKVMIVRIP